MLLYILKYKPLLDKHAIILHFALLINNPCFRYTRLQLDQATREEIGRQCKRVLDYGRLLYLKETTDMDVQLKYYVDPFISLENALIVVTRPVVSG